MLNNIKSIESQEHISKLNSGYFNNSNNKNKINPNTILNTQELRPKDDTIDYNNNLNNNSNQKDQMESVINI